MRFQTSQSMKLSQQMKLGPRMIQSMEILQMPLVELEERIEAELASNPTIELVEAERDDASLDQGRADHIEANTAAATAELDTGTDADFARLDDFESDNPDIADNAYESIASNTRDESPERTRTRDDIHDPGYSRNRLAGESDAKHEAMSNAPARRGSLHDQLRDQWAFAEIEPRLRILGGLIITNLEDDGYLRTELADLIARAPANTIAALGDPPEPAELELALSAVQLLCEPTGVAARTPRECLLLQLDTMLDQVERGDREPDPNISIAATLVGSHFDDLTNNRMPRIAERSGLSLDAIKNGLGVLRRLSLAPARDLIDHRPEPIVPDAIVEYDDEHDRYVAFLNDRRIPNLRLNREYAMMSKDRGVPKNDRDFLKTNIANASWLIDAVAQRKQTLLRVLSVVVEEQREWFDYGPDALKPLPMTGVAERLGIHVATVSRAVSDKFIETPRGIVALRGFFTGGLQTESGEDMSYDAVKAALKDIIEQENKAKPYSDEALVKQLGERGIEIARRTVAKYRDQMSIPAARMRKQF